MLLSDMMQQFKYAVLPPAEHGGLQRAFLFEIVTFEEGIYSYAGLLVQNTIWMKEISC